MKLTSRSVVVSVALGAIVLLLGACGGSDEESSTSGTPTGAAFDQAFIDAMVPHHEGAIAMATAAKEAGLSQSDLVKVADDILATQQVEIDRMKQWREEWFGSSTIDPKGLRPLVSASRRWGCSTTPTGGTAAPGGVAILAPSPHNSQPLQD